MEETVLLIFTIFVQQSWKCLYQNTYALLLLRCVHTGRYLDYLGDHSPCKVNVQPRLGGVNPPATRQPLVSLPHSLSRDVKVKKKGNLFRRCCAWLCINSQSAVCVHVTVPETDSYSSGLQG